MLAGPLGGQQVVGQADHVAPGVGDLDQPRELRTGWLVEVADPWGNVIGLTDYLLAPERARQREDGQPPR